MGMTGETGKEKEGEETSDSAPWGRVRTVRPLLRRDERLNRRSKCTSRLIASTWTRRARLNDECVLQSHRYSGPSCRPKCLIDALKSRQLPRQGTVSRSSSFTEWS